MTNINVRTSLSISDHEESKEVRFLTQNENPRCIHRPYPCLSSGSPGWSSASWRWPADAFSTTVRGKSKNGSAESCTSRNKPLCWSLESRSIKSKEYTCITLGVVNTRETASSTNAANAQCMLFLPKIFISAVVRILVGGPAAMRLIHQPHVLRTSRQGV